jgi:hypothetical protein
MIIDVGKNCHMYQGSSVAAATSESWHLKGRTPKVYTFSVMFI